MGVKKLTKRASVAIVTRNRKEVTLGCLDSLLKMDYPSFEAIVIDNDSTDGAPEVIKKRFSQVKVFKAQENLGLNGGKT